ncbi:hypothetical protein [Asticcacaulis machinosus]|uniref:Uncharacterized protein n=1 Tax=Asticcacaulis machinosus TaxID=2984211 RepID=A0ABT5HM65_9CAUL|nr:hypothetical protein [Asticcacaulis machinosus]MDC7677344.1 hypothetical protein [Asticcacaulis machinosus]
MRLPFIFVGQFETTANGTKVRRWFRKYAYALQDEALTQKIKSTINSSKLTVISQALGTGSFLFAMCLSYMLGGIDWLSFWNIILMSIIALPFSLAYLIYNEWQLNRLLKTAPRHSEAVSR